MVTPTSHSNWIIPSKVIIGAYPDPKEHFLDDLIVVTGVTTIISLLEIKEADSLRNYKQKAMELSRYIKFINIPIPDRGITEDQIVINLVNRILKIIDNGEVIYVHCLGGHGRSGTIGAILLSKYYNIDAENAFCMLKREHSKRKYKPRMKCPQSASQYAQVRRLSNKSKDIYFYNEKEEYGELSNFWSVSLHKKRYNKPFSLNIDGLSWKSVEEYYQAQKFLGPTATLWDIEYYNIIRSTNTPSKAAMLGRQKRIGRFSHRWMVNTKDRRLLIDIIQEYNNKVRLRDDWNDVNIEIMKRGLYAKFTQNKELMLVLSSTKPNALHEHTTRDMFWGNGGVNKNGKDMLGTLLVELRDETYK